RPKRPTGRSSPAGRAAPRRASGGAGTGPAGRCSPPPTGTRCTTSTPTSPTGRTGAWRTSTPAGSGTSRSPSACPTRSPAGSAAGRPPTAPSPTARTGSAASGRRPSWPPAGRATSGRRPAPTRTCCPRCPRAPSPAWTRPTSTPSWSGTRPSEPPGAGRAGTGAPHRPAPGPLAPPAPRRDTRPMEAAARAPHPALRRHVPLYRGYRYSAGAAVWRREPPAGSVTVIVNLGGRFRAGWVGSAGPAFEVAPVSSFISGMHDRAAYTLDGGEQYGVEFEPTPTGAYALFGLPLRELAGEIVPLEEVLGPQARGLVERMAEAPGWAERFDLLDAALLDRARHPAAVHPMVARAWEVLASSDGRATVTELCRETGYGRRHLTARFHDQLGLAPKAAARVLRFRSAL